MREIFEQLCRGDGFKATEAYTGNALGIVRHAKIGGGNFCTKGQFWNGCLPNWWDRVEEIRFRADEMPEVYFRTEKSERFLTSAE